MSVRSSEFNLLGGFLSDILRSGRRRRCESKAAGAPCTFCLKRGWTCSNGELSGNLRSKYDASLVASGSTVDQDSFRHSQGRKCHLPAQPLCVELVKLYFNYVHDQFHTLFHQPSFMEDVTSGQAPPVLLFGMLALSAR